MQSCLSEAVVCARARVCVLFFSVLHVDPLDTLSVAVAATLAQHQAASVKVSFFFYFPSILFFFQLLLICY